MILPPIELRKIHHENLGTLRKWRNNPLVYKWCRQFEQISVEDHAIWYAMLKEKKDTKMYEIWSDDGLYGCCGLTSIDWVNRRAEFSLYIAPEHHGRGFGEAALRALLRHGFSVLNLNLIWGESFDGNPAVKIFKKVGLRPAGARREFYYRDGKYIDAHLWDITQSEYLGVSHGIGLKPVRSCDIAILPR